MEAASVEIFIKATATYFSVITDTEAEIGTPFLKEDFIVAGDYTSTIGISGAQKGCISFSVPKAMIQDILNQMGEKTEDEALISDLVGEIANTISANAREHLGAGFMISVPIVVSGPTSSIRVSEKLTTFIIPLKWKVYQAYLSISLQSLAV
ncbi:MAG: chemotaxis protein CheX [Verrucomicrobiota bacterium]